VAVELNLDFLASGVSESANLVGRLADDELGTFEDA
jgi:hypothetical protein